MQTFLRALRLLVMVAWVGGLAFFAFVVAPVAFHVLPGAHEAGLVVENCTYGQPCDQCAEST